MKKRITCMLLSFLLLFCLSGTMYAENEELSAPAGLSNFFPSRSYIVGQFSDVGEKDWFAEGVQAAFEYGLINGTSETTFSPDSSITIAETLALASRLHNIYYGGTGVFEPSSPWYQVYIDYAIQHNIIGEQEYPDYTVNATRTAFANILAASVPAEALPGVNTVEDDAIPDVPYTDSAESIYLLYRAGILTGTDEHGTFLPHNSIQRSEVAALVTRIANPALRKSICLEITAENYIYLAVSDFHHIRNLYPSATAQCAYVSVYRNEDNEVCVLTDIRYKIESNWGEFTYHNLTTGQTITNPDEYFSDMGDRAFGATRIYYMDLSTDFMKKHLVMLQSLSSILKGGSNLSDGAFVDASTLNF